MNRLLHVLNTGSLVRYSECSPMAGRPGFNSRSSHTKDSKVVLAAALLNTQHYKVRIKGKVEQFREKSSALPYTSV